MTTRALHALMALAWAALIVAGRWPGRPIPTRPRARFTLRLATPPKPVVAMAVAVALWQAPFLTIAAALALWTRPRMARAKAERRRQAEIEADLPEVIDLLRMCVGAGLTIPLAIEAVARRAPGPVAQVLGAAVAHASTRGRRLADELDMLTAPSRLGEPARPLVNVLTGCERYGHAIGPALERLAAECRADERRRAETAARRLPVLLLFPLVLCILPAFALLTVAPLLANALRALRL